MNLEQVTFMKFNSKKMKKQSHRTSSSTTIPVSKQLPLPHHLHPQHHHDKYIQKLDHDCNFTIINGKSKPTIQQIHLISHQLISQVSIGFGHVFILCKSGQLYGFGRNDCNQLGLNALTEDDVNIVTQIPCQDFQSEILSVHCGALHSMIITHDYKVYSCGSNTLGQCSLNNSTSEIKKFTKCDTSLINKYIQEQSMLNGSGTSSSHSGGSNRNELSKNEFKNLHCRFAHCGILLNDGTLFFCGRLVFFIYYI